jgi:hypothetical protein
MHSQHLMKKPPPQSPPAQGGFVALADACCRPARLAFCQCPPRHLKHRWVGVEGHGRWPSPDRHRRSASSAAPLVLAVTPAMLAQWSLRERGPLILTAPMRTVEQLPVPFALLEEGTLSIEPAPTDRSQPRPSRQLRDTIEFFEFQYHNLQGKGISQRGSYTNN